MATILVSSAHAAGLGRLTVLSALGQPLSAEIELTSVAKEEADTLAVRLASADAFRKANIALNPAVLAMRFVVVQSGGRQFIRVSSTQPINEPFVDLLLELDGVNGRLVREYTFLLDPANLRSAQVGAASSVQERASSSVSATPLSGAAASTSNTTTTAPALAPPPAGPSPVAVRAQPASSAASTDKMYQIKRGDSLTQIALQSRSTGVSLDQMLVALYRANPAAFVGENMNRMRTGEILTIPTVDASRGVDALEARRVIVAQAQDFNSYRNKLAGQISASAPQSESEAKRSDSGKITAKVEESNNAAADSKDKLKLSKSGAASAVSQKNASVASIEESIAKDKALAEANSRVRDLERNVADLQKLLELKSKDMAEQQKRADLVAKPETPVAELPPPVPAVTPPAVLAPSLLTDEKKNEPPVTITPPLIAAPAVTPPVEVAVEKPKMPVVVPVPIAAEASLIERAVGNAYLLPGLGLLLVALGGFGIFSSRRKKKTQQFENSLLAESNLKTNSMFGSSGGESVDTNNSVFNSNFAPTSSQLDANEVDPVAEADVYIAYGRDAQAEEILKEALRTQPERNAVRLKLLEIYANRKDVAAFELMASELYGRTKGEGEEWSQAASLGIALDPHNPMYVGGKALEAPSMLLAADLGAPTRPMEDLDLDALLAATQTNMTADRFEAAIPEVDVPVTDELVPSPRSAVAASVIAPEVAPVVDDGLDFDLAGFDVFPAASADATGETVKPAITGSADTNDELSMDFDVADSVTDKRTTMESEFPFGGVDVPAAPDLSLLGTEPPLSAFPVDESLEEDRHSSQSDAADPLDFDLSGISLELDPDKSTGSDMGALSTEITPATSSVESAEDSLLNAPEMATKLDLAVAYEEIGDKEGARELLDEVISGGSNEQIRQATAMLAKLG